MRTTKFYTLLRISKPFAFNMRYYDIDNIFTDKTTYLHWLPNDILNIIKTLTIIHYQPNNIICIGTDSNYSQRYYKIHSWFILLHDDYPIFRHSENILRFGHKNLKQLYDNNEIFIYIKRPSCSII